MIVTNTDNKNNSSIINNRIQVSSIEGGVSNRLSFYQRLRFVRFIPLLRVALCVVIVIITSQSFLSSSPSLFIMASQNIGTSSLLLQQKHRLFPGTALKRMQLISKRVSSLDPVEDLSVQWTDVRKSLLNAAGLRDIDDQRRIGVGYTGHCFNDANHCDATAMLLSTSSSTNDGKKGVHQSIARGNFLGDGIKKASFPLTDDTDPNEGTNSTEEVAEDAGGTWCTCMNGCNSEDNGDGIPRDVAHRQFKV